MSPPSLLHQMVEAATAYKPLNAVGPIKPQTHNDVVSGVVYAPEFDILITASVGSVVRVWHATTGKFIVYTM